MKTRSPWTVTVAAAFAAIVGVTSWAHSPKAETPALPEYVYSPAASAPMLDSAHWASLINAYTDPTEGMASAVQARGDSLLRHPGAIGWGADALTCQDAMRAGSGTMKVWKVTDTLETSNPGTLRAALDSVDLYDNATTCQYIVFPQSGNFRHRDDDAPNYDFMQNWRISGQMAQGNGVNWLRGYIRARRSFDWGIEYLMTYRTTGDGLNFYGSSDMMNSRRSYVRHLSVAWGESGSQVQISYSAGTESVPQFSDTSEYHTIEGVLLGEPDSLRSLAFISGGMEEPDEKQRYVTFTESYMHGSGWRMPNASSAAKSQFIRLIAYNSTARAGELGRAEHQDFIDYYMRPGPMTTAIGTPGVAEESGWPLLVLGGDIQSLIRNGYSDSAWLVANTTADSADAGILAAMATPDTASWYIYGIRGPQNGYAVGMDSINLWRGPNRVTACGNGHLWFQPPHTSGPTYCQVDGDSLPLDATNDSLMRNFVRWTPLPLANRAPSVRADPMPTEPFTDTAVAKVIRFAGNSRMLTCSGEWTFRADTVATRWRQEWIDSTDAGDHIAGGGINRATRTWGTNPGTACSDSDNDGMPNAYEFLQVGDSTALAIDSMSYGRPAFEWYLEGRNLDATLVGCEALDCAAEANAATALTLDPWWGLCSQAEALEDADSLKMPCLLGPGARRPPQLDSIVAGVAGATMHVYRVTDYTSSTTHGSYRAGIDSALAWTNGKSCTAIVFPTGGNVNFNNSAGAQNADDVECVYIIGQSAQGEGVNLIGNSIRARRDSLDGANGGEWYVGYTYLRGLGETGGNWFGAAGDMYGQSGIYLEHNSRSWANATSDNLMTIGCGTAAVSLEGNICRDFSVVRNLFFEAGADTAAGATPTGLHIGGITPDTAATSYTGVNKAARALIYGNYFGSVAYRTPLYGNTDSVVAMENIRYNQMRFGPQVGTDRMLRSQVNIFNEMDREGPAQEVTDAAFGWATVLFIADTSVASGPWAGADSVSIYMRNVRHINNGYDSLSTPDSIHRGSKRITACDDNVTKYVGYCAVAGDSLPPAVWQGYTDTLRFHMYDSRLVTAAAPYQTLTDTLLKLNIAIAGNSRYLTCSGKWSLRSDTIDVRARSEYTNGSPAITNRITQWLGQLDTLRSYSAPAAGTGCTDTDSDGLPDLWESEQTGGASTTSIPADSVMNGLPAILWYASGRTMDGALIGCVGCSAEVGNPVYSFGSVPRYVYFVPMVTMFGVSMPDYSPISDIAYGILNQAGDTMMVVSCTQSTTPVDSATIDARVGSVGWNRPGINTARQVRDFTPFSFMGC